LTLIFYICDICVLPDKSADGETSIEVPWERVGGYGDGALMQRAIDLVRTHGGASASLLQRRLRVGYPKAARMIDQMEEMGIIGPPEGAGRMRAVIAR
jgi:S-DNA-T family DNA segregation ATPase FtsK/SpoIIIE